MSPRVIDTILEQANQLIEQVLIEPSSSEWNSPVVMARKSDGSYRLCIDFRKINEVSKKDAHPIPFIPKILE